MKVTIGGNRLGSGKKMTADLKTYERSTHDLGYLWRSTMAAGTLVPCMTEVGLPGDTFDIDLETDIKTHPTIGPLFGSYKVQLDVFQCPVRLYQAQLHNNKIGIGMKMSNIKLPQLLLWGENPDVTKGSADNQQINPSSILSYLNIRGIGGDGTDNRSTVGRYFNAIPLLAYWDIYKNYYANKQEEIGAVIHGQRSAVIKNVTQVNILTRNGNGEVITLPVANESQTPGEAQALPGSTMDIICSGNPRTAIEDIRLNDPRYGWNNPWFYFSNLEIIGNTYRFTGVKLESGWGINQWRYVTRTDLNEVVPRVQTFPLKNIDDYRENILAAVHNPNAVIIDKTAGWPIGLVLDEGGELYNCLNSQEGLAVKTYQSDLFNNWMSTEWIDGDNGIAAVTAVDTSEGSFTMDTLNLSKKVYDMLNRIAISGGSYNDWIETVYTHDTFRKAETPIYHGGLIKELVFQEVVSNSASTDQPLGQLAGKGGLSKKHKGGKITIKVDEPSYIMGIISLTPRVDYSQGNKWDVNLKTMDDFHKPALDEIGFQDLITDQMAWWDTRIIDGEPVYKSAGKQPAWVNYMTNVNQVRGNFAIEDNEMFMTLNRRYEIDPATKGIKDLTTYIDPAKYNNIFAETSRDAQNFWTQIAVNITARRKMSAKLMPNL